MLLYSCLYLCGYGLELEDLKNFRQLGSPCAGHPEYGHAAGIEATTGPLGQGISTCVGLALAERMLAARYNRPGHQLIDHFTFTICSDGDLEEGISSEASSLAGHLGLGRLIAFYDDNHISIEGNTEVAFSEDVGSRYEAYGWHVQHVGEDLALDRIEEAARTAMAVSDRPSLIVCRTHIGYGSPNKQDTGEAHGSPLGEEEIRLTKEFYGWPTEPPFLVPDEALAHFRETIPAGEELQREWEARCADYAKAHPNEAAELEDIFARRVPKLPKGLLKRFEPGTKIATRKASESVLQVAAALVPSLVGGSADLAPSTLTLIADGGSVSRSDYSGRNFHFGIREHGMGAVVNGLTLERPARLRRDVPRLLRLHEGRAAHRGAEPAAGDLHLHARLDRAGRGRPDAPADRAARGAARDTEHQRRASSGRARDGAGVELRAARDAYADRVSPVTSEPPGARRGCDSRGRDRAWRLRARRLRRPTRDRPDRDRLGGLAVRRGRRGAALRRCRRARREHAVRRSLRRARARRAGGGYRPGGNTAHRRRGGKPDRVGPLHRRTRRDDRHAHIRCLGAGGRCLQTLRTMAMIQLRIVVSTQVVTVGVESSYVEAIKGLPKGIYRELPLATAPSQGRSAADREAARQMLEILKQGADFRSRKVRRLRGAIHADKFENELKLDIALDRLVEHLKENEQF